MPVPLRALLAALALSAVTGAVSADPNARGTDGLRDRRYCELIVVKRDGLHLKATVYNTLGLNDCPQEKWAALNEAELKRQFDAAEVMLNGPRHWVLDGIVAGGEAAAGATVEVGGLGFTSRAMLQLPLIGARSRPYEERTIERTTQWMYSAGKPMFVLTGPDGSRYAMQSYALIVDRQLSYEQLAGLGSRLALPTGWSYAVRVPKADVAYPAMGQATVIQDELENTYQKLPAAER
jgi:hypothetical protein